MHLVEKAEQSWYYLENNNKYHLQAMCLSSNLSIWQKLSRLFFMLAIVWFSSFTSEEIEGQERWSYLSQDTMIESFNLRIEGNNPAFNHKLNSKKKKKKKRNERKKEKKGM